MAQARSAPHALGRIRGRCDGVQDDAATAGRCLDVGAGAREDRRGQPRLAGGPAGRGEGEPGADRRMCRRVDAQRRATRRDGGEGLPRLGLVGETIRFGSASPLPFREGFALGDARLGFVLLGADHAEAQALGRARPACAHVPERERRGVGDVGGRSGLALSEGLGRQGGDGEHRLEASGPGLPEHESPPRQPQGHDLCAPGPGQRLGSPANPRGRDREGKRRRRAASPLDGERYLGAWRLGLRDLAFRRARPRLAEGGENGCACIARSEIPFDGDMRRAAPVARPDEAEHGLVGEPREVASVGVRARAEEAPGRKRLGPAPGKGGGASLAVSKRLTGRG